MFARTPNFWKAKTWPSSWIRIEMKTHAIHKRRKGTPPLRKVPQPRNALRTQKKGCTRTGTPKRRKRQSYGVGLGSIRITAGASFGSRLLAGVIVEGIPF